MKLVQAQVTLFRNILDSTPVAIQPDVTCLVGKNESGKTAFLQALYRLKPARPNAPMSVPDQYPAWLEKRHRMEGKKLEKVTPIKAVFKLEADDRKELEAVFGPKVLRADELHISRSYDNKATYTSGSPVDEREAARHVAAGIPRTSTIQKDLRGVNTFKDLGELAATLKAKGADEQPGEVQAGNELEAAITEVLGGKEFATVAWELLEERIPTFFYFADYAKLPYSVKIRELLTTDPKGLPDDQLTARSLLRQAAAEGDYLLNPDYERRKRELENVANAITVDVNQYWTQNDQLRVQPDITQRTEQASTGQQTVIDELKMRIYDDRHGLSLPFTEHSSGFQWFFSFLAAFSEFEYMEPPVIVLLDEPALGLHARAQADFLRFIDERLSKRCQVVYSTHSPFMVQPRKLERARVVEDKGREEGTKVTQDILSTDPDTLFPLQAALGYDLVQYLFIAPDNLLVEGTSDYTYLVVISDYLRGQAGRVALDQRWSVLPVGSADMIPTFVSLLGQHLDITVLVDSREKGHQRLTRLAADGYLAKQRIVTVGEIIGQRHGDIEDLFDPDDYLRLFNDAFGTTVKVTDLAGNDPIVQRLARHRGGRFDHGKPADVLLRKRDEVLPKLSAATLQRFEQLFTRLNATLTKN